MASSSVLFSQWGLNFGKIEATGKPVSVDIVGCQKES